MSASETLTGQAIWEDVRRAPGVLETPTRDDLPLLQEGAVVIMTPRPTDTRKQDRWTTVWPAPRIPETEIQKWASDAQDRGIWCTRRREAMPLTEFPDGHLERIREEVEQDWKPNFWLDLGLAQVPSRAWYEWHWQRGVDPDARRSAIPRFIRDQVMERDGLVCQICFTDVDVADVHLDHIKPWSLGGEHSVKNLRVTHSVCNMRKAAHWDGEDA